MNHRIGGKSTRKNRKTKKAQHVKIRVHEKIILQKKTSNVPRKNLK